MNKFVILSVFVVALAFVNAADTSSSSSENNIKELAEVLTSKFNTTIFIDVLRLAEKAKAKCPNIETQVEEAAEKVGKCMEDIERGSDTLCSLIKKNFAKCAKPATDLVASCLPEESKNLPEMGERMVLAVINQVCQSTVEEILELMNPCLMEKPFDSVPVCQEIKTVAEQYRNKLPTKSLVCSMVPKVSSCIKTHQEASCKNSVTKQAMMKFHNAIEASIKEECKA